MTELFIILLAAFIILCGLLVLSGDIKDGLHRIAEGLEKMEKKP